MILTESYVCINVLMIVFLYMIIHITEYYPVLYH